MILLFKFCLQEVTAQFEAQFCHRLRENMYHGCIWEQRHSVSKTHICERSFTATACTQSTNAHGWNDTLSKALNI